MRASYLGAMILLTLAAARSQEFQTTVFPSAFNNFSSYPPPVLMDLDGNAYLEVVGRGSTSDVLTVLRDFGSNPVAAFASASPLASVGGVIVFVGTGEFDGNAGKDLLVLSNLGPTFGVFQLINDGNGAFGTPNQVVTAAFGLSGLSIYVADFNGDGLDDLSVGSTGIIRVFTCTPGTWPNSFSLPGSSSLGLRGVGDFDGNGIRDLLVSDTVSGQVLVAVLPGSTTGFGNLVLSTYYSAFPSLPSWRHSIADVNGDGMDDAVVRGANTSNPPPFAVVFGSSIAPLSSFAITVPTFPAPPNASTLELILADTDGDHQRDVLSRWTQFCSSPVTGCTNLHGIITSSRNHGGGSFGLDGIVVWEPPSGKRLSDFGTYEDFDGDGDVDILVEVSTPYSWAYAENRAVYGSGCSGSAGIPVFSIGAAYPGNAAFALSVSNAAPNAPAALFLSLAASGGASACGPLIDLSPAALILPSGSGSGAAFTDAAGQASFALPIPASAGLVGARVYAQWAVVDAGGSLAVGTLNLATSPARTITVF